MKFEFNHLDELQDFLNWAGYVKLSAAPTQPFPFVVNVQPATDTTVGGHSVFVAGDGRPADQEARDLKIGPYEPADQPDHIRNAKPPEPEADKPKRTRRTKAEIEAERAAAAVAQDNADATASLAPTNARAAIEMALAAAEASQAVKAAESAFEQALETAIAVKEEPASGEVLAVADYIKSRTAEVPEVSQIDHLNLARGFIAKHGIAKYNETFALAGLQQNVMAYSPADCAVHAATLEWLGSSLAA